MRPTIQELGQRGLAYIRTQRRPQVEIYAMGLKRRAPSERSEDEQSCPVNMCRPDTGATLPAQELGLCRRHARQLCAPMKQQLERARGPRQFAAIMLEVVKELRNKDPHWSPWALRVELYTLKITRERTYVGADHPGAKIEYRITRALGMRDAALLAWRHDITTDPARVVMISGRGQTAAAASSWIAHGCWSVSDLDGGRQQRGSLGSALYMWREQAASSEGRAIHELTKRGLSIERASELLTRASRVGAVEL